MEDFKGIITVVKKKKKEMNKLNESTKRINSPPKSLVKPSFVNA